MFQYITYLVGGCMCACVVQRIVVSTVNMNMSSICVYVYKVLYVCMCADIIVCNRVQ